MLEDELDILVELCKALVKLHAILIPLDFKLCGSTWKVYGSLVKDYQERLAERLPQGEAVEVLAGALVTNLQNLHHLARGGEEDAKKMEKEVIKTGALMKLFSLVATAATSSDKVVAKACPHLLHQHHYHNHHHCHHHHNHYLYQHRQVVAEACPQLLQLLLDLQQPPVAPPWLARGGR